MTRRLSALEPRPLTFADGCIIGAVIAVLLCAPMFLGGW